jgi:hypothetical protein
MKPFAAALALLPAALPAQMQPVSDLRTPKMIPVEVAQPTVAGTPAEPVRVLDPKIDLDRHDGGLTPVVGVQTYQVMRANRTHPEWAEGFGFTYNHVPMLAYWDGRFYFEFNSNAYGEQVAPGHTMIASSSNGRDWDFPREAFPLYYLDVPPFRNHTGEIGMALTHGVMGFYSAPNGRHLAMTYYAVKPSQNHSTGWGLHQGPWGIGRAVREIRKDGSFGPIYFVRYNDHYADGTPEVPGWSEKNTPWPYYRSSPDKGFVDACDAMLADPFKEMSWWEYEYPMNPFKIGPMEAPSIYRRKDGVAVAVWKWSGACLSYNDGRNWTEVVKVPTIVTAGAKVWGQRTSDGRYALVYNPAHDGYHRWPLAVATSDDGITFDHLSLVDGEIAPRRYMGRAKDFGLQYVRGIPYDDGNPPGGDMWLAYSTKEDLWVSRVPVPIRTDVDGPVSDDFNGCEVGGEIKDWNTRSGKWAPVGVVAFPSARNRSLQLEDRDPYNWANAQRVFHEGSSAHVAFRFYPHQSDTGRMEIEVLDRTGRRPVRLAFADDGHVWVSDGGKETDAGPYKANRWCRIAIDVDAAKGTFDASLDGRPVARQAAFAEPASNVKRLSFRTAEYPADQSRKVSRDIGGRDLPGAGEPVRAALYNIDDVTIRN